MLLLLVLGCGELLEEFEVDSKEIDHIHSSI